MGGMLPLFSESDLFVLFCDALKVCINSRPTPIPPLEDKTFKTSFFFSPSKMNLLRLGFIQHSQPDNVILATRDPNFKTSLRETILKTSLQPP